MLLTTQQAAEKLGIHRSSLLRLVKLGTIKPANKIEEGKTKAVWKFDSKIISALKKDGSIKIRKSRNNGNHESENKITSISTRLTNIEYSIQTLESKINKLISTWT
jgi:excisionase family DNA binding protein